MTRMVIVASTCLALALSAACNFSIGSSYEIDKANKLVDEANTLQRDADTLLKDTMAKYDATVKPALASDEPLAELGALEEPLKQLLPPLETAMGKYRDAAQKSEDASKLNVQDWFKQYLSARAELLRKEADATALNSKLIKITYDPSIATDEELSKQVKAVNAEIADIKKQEDELTKKTDKIQADHKDDFKQ